MNSSDSELHQSAIKGSSGSQSDSILRESGDSNKRNKFTSNFQSNQNESLQKFSSHAVLYPEKNLKFLNSQANLVEEEDIPEEIRMRETGMSHIKPQEIIEEEPFEEIEIDEALKEEISEEIQEDYEDFSP